MPFLFLLTLIALGVLWIKTAIQSRRLLKEFRERMPQQAFAALPEAFVVGRHPKKVWFFLTSKAEKILGADARLAEMRRVFFRMSIASISVPVLLFLIAAIVILLSTP